MTLTLAFKWAFTLNEGECESEFLPPAKEVWGKVIFSQACVKNSVHRGVPGPRGVCSGGGAWSWGALLPGGLLRGEAGGDHPGMATAAGGKHHTGMHSCFLVFIAA